jgi:DnaJ homolog subfamily C member 28
MNRWESAIDQAIRKAMEAGEFKNLPGEGKPLDLNDDANTPADLQLAYKIMRDNGIAPDWVAQGRELETKQTQWCARLKSVYAAYQQSGNETIWQADWAKFSEEANRLNREILSYNLKLPSGVAHRALMDMKRELERIDVV